MTEKKSQKEQMEDLVDLLTNWQDLEVKGISFLTELQGTTDNPVLREVLEIIKKRGAAFHEYF